MVGVSRVNANWPSGQGGFVSHLRSVVAVGGAASSSSSAHTVRAAHLRSEDVVQGRVSYWRSRSHCWHGSQSVLVVFVHGAWRYDCPCTHASHTAHARSEEEVQGAVSYSPSSHGVHGFEQVVSEVRVHGETTVLPSCVHWAHGLHSLSEVGVGGIDSKVLPSVHADTFAHAVFVI